MSHLLTAQHTALLPCHACGLLSPAGKARHCPRCLATLHQRKPDSLARTWAFVITAAVLYIPANVLPIMSVVSMGREQSDTILSGILYFLKNGSWPLATLIFFASIVVPFLKLTILTFLMVSVHRRSRWKPRLRARMYRLTEDIGRWSMLDIFVVTIMVAMVAMGAIATIEPGPGAVAFALVVVATILASRSFDPRLIWDAMESGNG